MNERERKGDRENKVMIMVIKGTREREGGGSERKTGKR